MASTVLPNGIIIPEKFSRDWYNDLYHNWQELDNLLGGGGANDGTLTIQKNGTTVGTFSANQATDETVNIEVPDVNNGTLTIQQNGTTVDTFTANSSTDKTVNIQCVDLTNNQTVGGIKTFSNAPVVNSISLDGKTVDTDANGNMTYDSHIVDTIEEQGEEYIRYSNGIQICWGYIGAGAAVTKNYPKSFLGDPYAVVSGDTTDPNMTTNTQRTSQAITAYRNREYYGCSYMAIGHWK